MSEVVGTSYGDDKDKAETDDPVEVRARCRGLVVRSFAGPLMFAQACTLLDRIVGLRSSRVVRSSSHASVT